MPLKFWLVGCSLSMLLAPIVHAQEPTPVARPTPAGGLAAAAESTTPTESTSSTFPTESPARPANCVQYDASAGAYIVPRAELEQLLDRMAELQRLSEHKAEFASTAFGRHTYCCRVPANGRPEKCNQFRAYSYEAPFVCVRWASSQGYGNGTLSRRECRDVNGCPQSGDERASIAAPCADCSSIALANPAAKLMTVADFIAHVEAEKSVAESEQARDWRRITACLSFHNGKLYYSAQLRYSGCPANVFGQEITHDQVRNIEMHHRLNQCPSPIEWYCCSFEMQ